MPKSVNIPGVGVVNFPDAMPNEQINSIIKTEILPKYGQAPKPSEGRGGVLPSFAEGFATGFTDIPLGIAGLFTSRPEETTAGKFSLGARDVIQDILGIDPTKEATTAETGASALGSLGSFLVPGLGAVKVAKGVGMGLRGAGAAGSIAGGLQGAALGSGEQAQRAMAQEQATGQKISDEARQSAQLLGGAIGLSEILPLQRFLGPLEKILAKVPLSKAGAVSKIMETGITRAAKSASAEGAQEAISQLAQNLVESGFYNPELDVTDGLLGNAAAGGFAGGTVDAILQLMAGRKVRKATSTRGQLEKQISAEASEAAPEIVRAQAIEGVNTLRAAAPAGSLSVIESQMPGDRNASYYIVGADKKPIVKFDSIDAAIAAGKQYEMDSNGVTKFEPPTITELVKMKKVKEPKLTKAQKNQARQEAKRLKAAGQLQPAPIAGPATTPEGQATTEASIEKVAAEEPIIAPKKGRKKLAPVEAPVPGAVLPPIDTAAEITLPEQPVAPPAALPMELAGAKPRYAMGSKQFTLNFKNDVEKALYITAQGKPSARDADYRNWLKGQGYSDSDIYSLGQRVKENIKAQAKSAETGGELNVVGLSGAPVAAAKLSVAPAAPTEAAATQPAVEVPEGFRQVVREVQPTIRVALRPLESTPEGAAKAAEMDAKKGRVADTLNKILAPIVAKDVRLNLVSHLKQGETYARGAVNPEGTVIDLALDIYDPALTEDQLIDKLMGVMNHEVIHTLRNANLLTPAEITTLFNATDKIKYQGKAFTYFDRAYRTYATIESYTTVNDAGDRIPNMDMINEEAVAEMFRDYRSGKLKVGEKPKGIFNKITQFFKRMFRGFREAEVGNVFTRIESGEVGARERVAAPAGAATKFSVAPAESTKEFKEWFGRSKVLDKQGRPLVVHHFGSFNEDEDIPRSGMHFGTQQAATERAAGKRAEDLAMGVQVYQNDDGLWHFDLDGVTSEDLGFIGFSQEESAMANGRSEALRMAAEDNSDPLEAGVITSAYLSLQNPKRMADLGGAEGEWDVAIEQAKAEGHDGIVYRNQYEDKGSDSYIAFEPTQIKSVNNRGTFSKEDGRIKFSVAPALDSDEFKRWFKKSKAVNEDVSPMIYYRGDPEALPDSQLGVSKAGVVSGEEGPYFFSPKPSVASEYATEVSGASETGTVYPVYVSVQNPFDYDDKNHVLQVARKVAKKESGFLNPAKRENLLNWYVSNLGNGHFLTLEMENVQKAIRELGFDGFFVEEGGVKNLAIYKSTQAKSIFNQFEPGTATSKKLSVSPTAYEAVPFVEKPAAVQKQILGDVERMRRKAVDIARDVSRKSDTTLDNSANAANIEVRNAVRKLSAIPQPQPQSAFFQAANATLFASAPTPTSTGEKLMDLLGGLGTSAGRTRIMDAFRVNYVQKQGQVAKYQRVAELAGKLESGMAQYSAVASSEMADRSSHQIPLIIEFGAGEVMMVNNDPNSKYFIVNENETENAPKQFSKLVYTGGPNGTSLMEQFKTILVARAVVKRQSEGKPTPIEVTPEYIKRAEDLALQYPVLEDAYNRYQKFNKKMIKAAMDAGVISQETFEKFTDDMNYYSLYREVGDEILSPAPYGATGRATNIKAYKGSQQGKLIADPMEAMIRNISFWTAATMRNIAAQKAHRVAMTVGIGRNLKWMGSTIGWESPDPNKGEDARYLSYNIDGKEFRYAVTDPLFATGLLNTEGHNMGLALELLGMPTTALRELVTRDPGFMIANLLRDSISTWILAGSGASPVGTFIGLKKSLMNDVSYQNLKRMAVVGSYDEAQKSPRQMVAGLKAGITNAQGLTGTVDAIKYGWDRLGKLSDASDAATRIAVYEAAIKDGVDEYTAAYRALSIMNFSRRGASMGISVATKLIPFLNARIQGFDVLYTGIKSGIQLAQGAEQTAFEKQRGAAVWYRGAALMAGALALAMINEDDEDYKQIPQYIKDANFLVPVGGSKFLSIPKPFEAGLIFGTVPTTMYDIMRGNRSTRSGIKLFTSQLGSTFGFNPMPQVALPLFENLTNSDFYTGMPLISPGMQKLDPSLQYNSSTSYVARSLGKLLAYTPLGYDFESGRFEGVSPIMIDNLITGYGGPIGGYVSMGIGGLIGAFGQDNQGIPIAGSNLPVIKRFFIDAQDRQPQAAAEAYEVYQLVDKATRTASRLKKMGDVEALKEFREENIDLLRVGKQVRKMAENLNNIRAQVRRLEVNTTMSGSEKKERMRELRAREIQITRKIDEINAKLGR